MNKCGGVLAESGALNTECRNNILSVSLDNYGIDNIENIKLRYFLPSNALDFTYIESENWTSHGEYYEYNNIISPGEISNEIYLKLKVLNEELCENKDNGCTIVAEWTTREIPEEY